MPVNKAAHFRFDIIDECLRNTKKKWSKADLLQYINRRLALHYGEDNQISLSQLRYDLENMQSECGAPIEMYREGKNYYYRYEDSEFSIKSIKVEEDDLVKLGQVVSILQQLKGFSIAGEIAAIVARLENRYNLPVSDIKTVILFDNAASYSGAEYLEDVYHAILRNNVLKLEYRSFKADANSVYIIHPYLLKEYDKRWYLLAYCEERKEVRVYALERIVSIRVLAKEYIANTFFDAEHYYDDFIGITKPKDASQESIDLMFTEVMAPYILTKPLHHTQQIIKQYEYGFVHVRISTIINQELINLILSFGKEAKVLSPGTLENKIKFIIHSLSELY